MTTAAGLLMSLLAAVAPADFSKADQLMVRGDFERAVEVLSKLDTPQAAPADRVRAALLLAQCYVGMGNWAKAGAALDEALKLDPKAALDAASAPPQLVTELEKRRATVPALLEISSHTPHAQVHVDGKDYGPPPLTVQVPPGPHRVELISAKGTVTQELTAAPGATHVVTLEVVVVGSHPPPDRVTTPKADPVTTPAVVAAEPVVVAAPQRRAHGPLSLAWVPAAAGVVLAGVGAVMLWQSNDAFQRLEGQAGYSSATWSTAQGQQIAGRGGLEQGLGVAGLALGGAGLLATLLLYLVPMLAGD